MFAGTLLTSTSARGETRERIIFWTTKRGACRIIVGHREH
jgi:hypothetical protein